ncbi:MAG: hypothetical protein ACYTAF_15745, partial [Planctomycetota bacterium]
MALLFALMLALQDTPADALAKFAEAVENKDVEALKALAADPERGGNPLTQEMVDGLYEKMVEETGDHLKEALHSYPAVGATHGSVTTVELRWTLALEEGLLRTRARFERVNGTWKFSRFHASLDKKKSSGEKGEKAEMPPGDVLKSVIAGVESGDFEKVAGALPEE